MVDIQFKFPDWAQAVKKAENKINLFIAAQIQHNRGQLFDSEGSWNGHDKWAPLVLRSGMVLSRRGTLRKSIAPYNPKGRPGPDGIVRFAGDEITVGTKVFYATLMNDGTKNMPGGVLRATRAKALMIPIPEGKAANKTAKEIAGKTKVTLPGRKRPSNVIFRKSVKIPPRPFDQWNGLDQLEVDTALVYMITRMLNYE